MFRANITDVTYFARGPLCSYFHEPQKNEIYFLNEPRRSKIGSSKENIIVGECKNDGFLSQKSENKY